MDPGHVVYGVIPRRFSAAGLAGIEDRLPALRELGVTALWLSPIFEHGPQDFGYGMTDYTKIDPEYGSEEDLQRLVRAAHGENLLVLLDFAPNHTSDSHRFYRDVRARGEDSPYADYYQRGDSGGYQHYFHWADLINLNYDNAAVRDMVIDAMRHWVVACDVDGFRMDAAWGIRMRSPAFWPACVQILRSCKPDLLLIAEASTLDGFYHEAGFDAAYDWSHQLGQWAWSDAFQDTAKPAPVLGRRLADSSGPGQVFRFLNNNDTGQRFITTHGSARYRTAAAVLLTSPGVPCIYMGDEVGLEFEPYARTGPVTWPVDDELTEFHRRLIALRNAYGLGSPGLTLLDNDSAEQCLSYSRPGASPFPLVCLFNFGPDAEIVVDVQIQGSRTAEDVWTGRTTAVRDAEVSLRMDQDAFALLRLGP
jgi:cyclomaltodextrinase / maltogenic alpha-amylase / neopullulanase